MKLDYVATKDGILKEYFLEIGLSKKFLRKVKLYGKMYINGVEVKNYFPFKVNDLLTLEYDEKENEEIVETDKEVDICYEEEHFLIINKDPFLAVQPSVKHFEDNVVSYIKAYYKKNNITSNVHIVNRLDYATSGLMVIAKDGLTHYQLTKEKIITRKYYAVIIGIMDKKEGIINLPIKREEEHTSNIKRMVASDGKEAITKYKVINENKEKNISLVDIELETGRTHQIRVHFQALGYPLLGDKLYGQESDRLYLHCYSVSFINPYDNKSITIERKPEFTNLF